METNVGSTDRYIRLVLGAVLAIVGLAGLLGIWAMNTVIAVVLVVVGAVFVGTGYTRQCLLYKPFGIDTS
jgi:hypothetical protein